MKRKILYFAGVFALLCASLLPVMGDDPGEQELPPPPPPGAHWIVNPTTAVVAGRQPNGDVDIIVAGTVSPAYPGGVVKMVFTDSAGNVTHHAFGMIAPGNTMFAGTVTISAPVAGPGTVLLYPLDNPIWSQTLIPVTIPM